jgi:hypothetical protein
VFDQQAPVAIGVASFVSASQVWSSNWDGRFLAKAMYESKGCGTRSGRRSASMGDSTAYIAVSSASVPVRNPTRRTRRSVNLPTPAIFVAMCCDVT